jgi:glyoxylase-like metal-dependent hydrolase (beta-lactamase superfamily II)
MLLEKGTMSDQPLMETRVPAIKRVNGAGVTPSGGPYALFSAEAYVVLTPEPVLVDCGGPPTYPELRDNLARVGIAPSDIELVIATHYHHDHMGNIIALREEAPHIPLALHEADVSAFVEANQPGNQAGPPSRAHGRTDPTRIDVALMDGQRLRYGHTTFEVLHTPGHTPGSAAIAVDVDGMHALFVGDTVHGLYFARPERDAAADLEQWSHSLGHLLALPFDLMFEGHVLPVHVLGNPSALAGPEKADLYNVLERRMADRRRGIAGSEAHAIIAAQQQVTDAKLLIAPEAWILQLAAQRAGEPEWEA